MITNYGTCRSNYSADRLKDMWRDDVENNRVKVHHESTFSGYVKIEPDDGIVYRYCGKFGCGYKQVKHLNDGEFTNVYWIYTDEYRLYGLIHVMKEYKDTLDGVMFDDSKKKEAKAVYKVYIKLCSEYLDILMDSRRIRLGEMENVEREMFNRFGIGHKEG